MKAGMGSSKFSRRGFMAVLAAVATALPIAGALAAPFASERITVRTEGTGPMSS
ncbi:hypothetical protein [Massilia sp. Se16.2.3]|uniref:hypothetical protein n=1 Tax=Massilia sp. Se16.2.3 TaxID=2709303 RepID=UPI001E29360D|nr:hypothetical protein [Massilia sp. Se16.2.3]